MTKEFIKLKNTKKNKKPKMPKKKYQYKRISFRNNNKNNNLRNKSLKIVKKKTKTYKNRILKKKGGAVSAKTFGLTKDQINANEIEVLKNQCDSLAPSPGQPADLWAINYVISRDTRLRCYSYYLNSIGFYKSLQKKWNSQYQALYNTYTILYNEDKSENSDIINSKKEYLLACQNFNDCKRTIITLATNYLIIFLNKKKRLSNAINRLKTALMLKIRSLKTEKPRDDEKIKKYNDWVKMKTEEIFKDPELLQKVFNYSALFYLKKINPNFTTADVLAKGREMNNDLEKVKKEAQELNENAIFAYNVSYITARGALFTLNFYLNANNLPNTPVVLPLRFNEREPSIIKKDMVSEEFAENKYDILFGFKTNEDDSDLANLRSDDIEEQLKKLERNPELKKSVSSMSSLTDNEDRLSAIGNEDKQNMGSLILEQQNAEENKDPTEQFQKLLKSDEGDTQDQLNAMSKFIEENPNFDVGVKTPESFGPYDKNLYSPTTYLPSNYEPSKTGILDSLISRFSKVFNPNKKESKPSKEEEGVELSSSSSSNNESPSIGESTSATNVTEQGSTMADSKSSIDASENPEDKLASDDLPLDTTKTDPKNKSDLPLDATKADPKDKPPPPYEDGNKDTSLKPGEPPPPYEKDKEPPSYDETVDFDTLQNTKFNGVPPTSTDVYELINRFSQNTTSDSSPRSGGASPSSSKLFSGCTPKLCQGFYDKINSTDTIIPVVSSLVEKSELNKLGGIINPENDEVNSTQVGLIMCKPQLDEAFKLYTKDKWFENLRGNQEKKCLICLYRGFLKLCQLRNIPLDSDLQSDVPNNYKVDRTVDDPSTTPLNTSQETDNSEPPVVDSRSRRPRGLDSIASIGNSSTNNPPIEILTDTRNKNKYIWIKISAAPDCLTGIIDNTYDSSEQAIKALINPDGNINSDGDSNNSSSNSTGSPPIAQVTNSEGVQIATPAR